MAAPAEFTTTDHLQDILDSFTQDENGYDFFPLDIGHNFFAYDERYGKWVSCINQDGYAWFDDWDNLMDCLAYIYGLIYIEGDRTDCY